MARPTKCNLRNTLKICKKLAGGESLRAICLSDETMPAQSSVFLWVVDGRLVEGTEKTFSEHYMQAREAAGFAHADRIVDVAILAADNAIDPQAARAAMDGLKWAAERMAPKKHSPRQELEHTSPDGSMTPAKTIITTDPIEAAKQYQDIMGGNE